MARIASLIVTGFLLFCAFGCQAHAEPNEDILAASKAGDKAGVEAALNQGASVNALDEKGISQDGLPGLTPLGLAAYYGHGNVATVLLDRSASLGSKDILERTPLHVAAEHGSADVAKILLDRGADVNARDLLGATPLGWATIGGHKNLAAMLIARGALVNART